MIVREPMPQIEDATLDSIMEAIGQSVSEGMAVSEAVDEMLPAMPLSPQVAQTMMRIGLIQFVHDRLHTWRRGRSDNDQWSFQSKFMVRPLTGASARADVLRRILLEGSEGYTKSLLAFTRADCQHFIEIANGQIAGWRAKQGAMEFTQARLDAVNAETISDLPVDEINRVADAIAEAWTG